MTLTLAALLLILLIAVGLAFARKPERIIVITPGVLAALPWLDHRFTSLPLVTPTRLFLALSIVALLQVRANPDVRLKGVAVLSTAYFVFAVSVTLGDGFTTQLLGAAIDVTLLPYMYLVTLYPRMSNLRFGPATAWVATLTLLLEVAVGGREFFTGSYAIDYPERSDPLAYAGTNPDLGIRVCGTFVTTEVYSLFCALLGLFLLGYWNRRGLPWLALLTTSIAFTGCILSGTRDILLSFIPLATIVYLHSSPRARPSERALRLSFGAAPLLIIGNWLFHPFMADSTFAQRAGNAGNIETRIASYEAAWHIFTDHVFLGVGFGRYFETAIQQRYLATFHGAVSVPFPHNSFLSVLAETGVLGLFIFGGLWGGILIQLRNSSSRSSTLPIGILLLMASMGVNLVQHQVALNATMFFLAISSQAVSPRPKQSHGDEGAAGPLLDSGPNSSSPKVFG